MDSEMRGELAQVAKGLQVQLAMELSENGMETCFNRCVPDATSDSSLSYRQKTCLSECMQAYFNTFQITADTVKNTLSKSGM